MSIFHDAEIYGDLVKPYPVVVENSQFKQPTNFRRVTSICIKVLVTVVAVAYLSKHRYARTQRRHVQTVTSSAGRGFTYLR